MSLRMRRVRADELRWRSDIMNELVVFVCWDFGYDLEVEGDGDADGGRFRLREEPVVVSFSSSKSASGAIKGETGNENDVEILRIDAIDVRAGGIDDRFEDSVGVFLESREERLVFCLVKANVLLFDTVKEQIVSDATRNGDRLTRRFEKVIEDLSDLDFVLKINKGGESCRR